MLPQWHAVEMYRSALTHVESVQREFNFDVILGAFAYPDVAAAARLARHFRCPLISLVMGSDMNELAQRPVLRSQVSADGLRQSRWIFGLSGALKQRVVELGIPPERILVQHNAVDGDRSRFATGDRHELRSVSVVIGESSVSSEFAA